MSDDRFDPDSKVFARAGTWRVQDWDEAMTPVDYFYKAIQHGSQEHQKVRTLRNFFPKAYLEAQTKFNEDQIAQREAMKESK